MGTSRPEPAHVDALREKYQTGMSLIPVHMRDGIRHYIERGRDVGGFLTRLLTGDLEGAKIYADPANTRGWDNWMKFLGEHMPSAAYGTQEKFAAWRAHKGLWGITDGEPGF